MNLIALQCSSTGVICQWASISAAAEWEEISMFCMENVVYTACCCCCSVAKLFLTLCDPVDCSTPGFPVLHYLPEFAQTHVPWVSDDIQPSYPLLSPSPSALNLSQNQGLFQWTGSLPHVAKVLELQLQHQSFQWIFRVDFIKDWLIWSPCSAKHSKKSSPAPQLESISSSALSLYGRALTSVHDYWKRRKNSHWSGVI